MSFSPHSDFRQTDNGYAHIMLLFPFHQFHINKMAPKFRTSFLHYFSLTVTFHSTRNLGCIAQFDKIQHVLHIN